jgi:hypothetical protein
MHSLFDLKHVVDQMTFDMDASLPEQLDWLRKLFDHRPHLKSVLEASSPATASQRPGTAAAQSMVRKS